LTLLFGDSEGYVFISSYDDNGELTQHKPYQYPAQLNQIGAYAAVRADEQLYFSPFLYSVPRRKATAVSVTPVIYADTDSFPVEGFLIPPSVNVRTSETKHHSYWFLDDVYTPKQVEEAARAIALTHASKVDGKQAGTDTGGWDLAQLLRLPNSVNLKYDEPFEVYVESVSGEIYSLDDITAVYNSESIPKRELLMTDEMPDDLPEPKDVLRRITASPHLSELYSTEPRGTQDWSDTLYRFVCELFRAGFSPEEVLVGAWYAACNKYRRDGRPMSDLWIYDVRKAEADPKNKPMSQTERFAADIERPKDEGLSQVLELVLLTEAERAQLTRTFIDDYIDWAVSKTDAPAAYHSAGALTAMSLVLGEWGVAYPQFGELRLGLFFVIMGETTDTRKTTARNMMKRLIRGAQSDEYKYILTSDTTPESLLDNLADRPNQSSLYDRDEAQQLVADIKGGKGYMKGFFETLNELYDGWAHGRLRQGRSTEDTKVNFVQYLMGIRSQIQENLELSDFISGWGPRNIFVRGEAPPRTREGNRLKQGVPGSAGTVDMVLMNLSLELVEARDYWAQMQHGDRENPYMMQFEDDAWIKQTDLEWDLKEYFKEHPRFEVLKPSLDRLSINVMKVAVLFAMMARRDKVNMTDVLNARYYAAQWVEDLVIVVEGVNETMYRRDLDAMEKFIIDNDGFVTYAKALRWATTNGKRKKEFIELIEVLAETDVIEIIEDGKGKKSLELIQHG